jgi:hypothetical protein
VAARRVRPCRPNLVGRLQEERMPGKWEPQPKHWRVRAKAADGMMVTLGRYATAEEAEADCAKFAKEGRYRDLSVQPIAPAPVAPPAKPEE